MAAGPLEPGLEEEGGEEQELPLPEPPPHKPPPPKRARPAAGGAAGPSQAGWGGSGGVPACRRRPSASPLGAPHSGCCVIQAHGGWSRRGSPPPRRRLAFETPPLPAPIPRPPPPPPPLQPARYRREPEGRNVMASEPPAPTPTAPRVTRTSARLTSGPWKRPATTCGGAAAAAAASPCSPPPGSGPSAIPGWPRFWEGQDVLARWTDGLLYLGTIKKVDPLRQVCLVQFEDDSQFLVLWKDINPAAVPGEESSCCVCHAEAVSPDNRLVRCEKCSHAYHQACHLPRVVSDTAWMCRQCVFAVATKRGGALKKGPYAKAMLGMKLVLPYQLKGLEWDAEHLTNRQQCYCYCGGPGEWNLKMLQCRLCAQWFHEACTQCLSKPLLYGDRFYIFECCVCRGGPESVRRLPLRWVDVAHLILYHLSICCKKKYFDFEREILPFASENWDSLLLGELSDTPKGERYSQLLNALTGHKDRFISGKEIKKRKGLFGLHLRLPPPAPQIVDGSEDRREPLISQSRFLSGQGRRGKRPAERRKARRKQQWHHHRRQRQPPAPSTTPEQRSARERERLEKALTQEVVQNPVSASQSYGGYSGTSSVYNFRRTDARCQDSAPIRMFASFHPSANTAGTLSTSSSGGTSLESGDAAAAEHEPPERRDLFLPCPAPAPTRRPPTAQLTTMTTTMATATLPAPSALCAPSSSSYFGAMGRLARGEAVRILARRVTTDGTVQYLVEWDGGGIF